MATDKNRIMISLDDKNLEKLENLVEDARDRRGMRLTKSQVIELLLVNYQVRFQLINTMLK
ncbi:TPA: CopG family transcriptional regulator [Streptococcus pneumoniae]